MFGDPFGGPFGPPPPPPRRRGCCGPGLCCLPLLLFGFCIAGVAKAIRKKKKA